FSSRRRHTRFSRDWSSDVCSSDLKKEIVLELPESLKAKIGDAFVDFWIHGESAINITDEDIKQIKVKKMWEIVDDESFQGYFIRSEERRVGKECRCWLAPDD